MPYCDNEHINHNEKYATNYNSLKIVPAENILIEANSSTLKNKI